MAKIKIRIPQPCHEDWQSMTPEDMFLRILSKKVLDFTNASDREIVTAFQQNKNLCGRFLNSQLDRDLIKPEEKPTAWVAAAVTIISLLGLGTNEISAQEPVKTEQTDNKVFLGKPASVNKPEIEISGSVEDAAGPLAGANIVIKGTKVATQADFDGVFKLKVKKGDILIFSFTGCNNKEYKIKDGRLLNIKLDCNVTLGQVIIGD